MPLVDNVLCENNASSLASKVRNQRWVAFAADKELSVRHYFCSKSQRKHDCVYEFFTMIYSQSMRVMRFMEDLLALEAEAKYLLASDDRTYEQKLMQELSRIFKEAELLFGPRDTSIQLSIPRITECANARSYILRPLGIARIYLSREARKAPSTASLELAHEAVHVLRPVGLGGRITILEEGLAEWFAQRYVGRVYGLTFEYGVDLKADAVMKAVANLLAKNQYVIKQLRTRQPVISKIDEKLLVEVAGIKPGDAKFLCTDFQSYWRTGSPLSDFAAQGAERLAACLRSIFK